VEKENPALTRYRFRLTRKVQQWTLKLCGGRWTTAGRWWMVEQQYLAKSRHTAASHLLFNTRFHQLGESLQGKHGQFCALPAAPVKGQADLAVAAAYQNQSLSIIAEVWAGKTDGRFPILYLEVSPVTQLERPTSELVLREEASVAQVMLPVLNRTLLQLSRRKYGG
jgi:hypothetical protein